MNLHPPILTPAIVQPITAPPFALDIAAAYARHEERLRILALWRDRDDRRRYPGPGNRLERRAAHANRRSSF